MKITHLTNEFHWCISKFLLEGDIKSLSQTCTGLQKPYRRIRYENISALHSLSKRNAVKCVTSHPFDYSWLSPDAVKKLHVLEEEHSTPLIDFLSTMYCNLVQISVITPRDRESSLCDFMRFLLPKGNHRMVIDLLVPGDFISCSPSRVTTLNLNYEAQDGPALDQLIGLGLTLEPLISLKSFSFDLSGDVYPSAGFLMPLKSLKFLGISMSGPATWDAIYLFFCYIKTETTCLTLEDFHLKYYTKKHVLSTISLESFQQSRPQVDISNLTMFSIERH